ncbi:MAG: hypothetical protein AB8G23_17960 [Myxococcota bacterium]
MSTLATFSRTTRRPHLANVPSRSLTAVLTSFFALMVGFTFAGLTLATSEASAATIVNHENVPITGDLSLAGVKKGIMKAAAARGWQIKESGPQELTARVMVRSHTAVITIKYKKDSYSIFYKDSTNLRHKPGDPGKIHGNYNKWVSILMNDIALELGF